MKATQAKDQTVLAVLSVDEAKALIDALKAQKTLLNTLLDYYHIHQDVVKISICSIQLVHVNNMLLVMESLSLD